ncbi:MAG: hydroxyethylthiazole kinase [Janthinobacterium lividum]
MILPFLDPDHLGTVVAAIRAQRPLVHCLTNQVAANLTANALLCIGASPLMAEADDEVATLSPDAVLINLGMQTPARMQAARIAVAAAQRRGISWVLDPVAAGALPLRTTLALELLAFRPAVIKGNASEIIALAGGHGGRGTDTTVPTLEAQELGEALARDTGAVIAITGPEDIVTDGHRTTFVRHGHPMMAQISGLGCAAGALIAACLTVETNAMLAATKALTMVGWAAELAAVRASGPASLQTGLLDELSQLGSEPVRTP